jgi:segregation and condensation protein B
MGFLMRVKEDYEEKVQHFAQNTLFSRSVMRTLALIAYKQPIAQSKVVAYRNNKAYDHLKLLLDEGMIKKDPRGRTFVLTTTTKFIEYFGKDFGKAKKNAQEAVAGVSVAQTSADSKSKLASQINAAMENVSK